MIEDTAHIESLIRADRGFESLGGSSDHKGINGCIGKVARDLRHISHAGHIRVAEHALRMV